MSSLNSSEDGRCRAAVCLHWEAGGVGVSCRWRAGGARNMEVSLITGDCSNVGITYTVIFGLAPKDEKNVEGGRECCVLHSDF
jgi:hypothetical protein